MLLELTESSGHCPPRGRQRVLVRTTMRDEQQAAVVMGRRRSLCHVRLETPAAEPHAAPKGR